MLFLTLVPSSHSLILYSYHIRLSHTFITPSLLTLLTIPVFLTLTVSLPFKIFLPHTYTINRYLQYNYTPKHLATTISTGHQSSSSHGAEKSKYKCDICAKEYVSQGELEAHIQKYYPASSDPATNKVGHCSILSYHRTRSAWLTGQLPQASTTA